jgi:dTDP-glucose pyrophosphorylase
MGWISKHDLLKLAEPLRKSAYGDYLISRAEESDAAAQTRG